MCSDSNVCKLALSGSNVSNYLLVQGRRKHSKFGWAKYFLNISYSIFSFGNIEIYVCKNIDINTIIPNCDENSIN